MKNDLRAPFSELSLPVPYHDTFDVLDSSKIQAFQDCPRGFFLRYILGLEPTEPNIHLVFGSAWHEAMEYLLNNGLSNESVLEAFQLFQEVYYEAYPRDLIDLGHGPKTPENALEALVQYAEKFKHEVIETLYTEVAGTVPIDQDRVIHFKLDSVIRDEEGFIWSMEHKTTGRKSQAWMDKWSLKTQVGTYSHALFMLYGLNEVRGVKINGAVLRKKSNEFIRIPVRKSKKMMQAWLWETKYWLDQIAWNMIELSKSSPSEDVLMAFPRNTESCCKFGCRYPGICPVMENPLQLQDDNGEIDLIGYRKNFWDPRDREEEAKVVAHLEKEVAIKENPNPKTKDYSKQREEG